MKKFEYKTIKKINISKGLIAYSFGEKIMNKEVIKRKVDSYNYDDFYYGQEYIEMSFEELINMLGRDGWELVMEKEDGEIIMKREYKSNEREKEEIKKERENFEKEKTEFIKEKEKFEKEKEEFEKEKNKRRKEDTKKIEKRIKIM